MVAVAKPIEATEGAMDMLRQWNDLGLKLFREGGMTLEVAVAAAKKSTAGVGVVDGDTEDTVASFVRTCVMEIAKRGAALRSKRLPSASADLLASDDYDDRAFLYADQAALSAVWDVVVHDPQRSSLFTHDCPGMSSEDDVNSEESRAAWLASFLVAIDGYVRARLIGLDWKLTVDRLTQLVADVESGNLAALDEYAPFCNWEDENAKHWHDRAVVALVQQRTSTGVGYFASEYGAYASMSDWPFDYRLGLIAWLAYRGLAPVEVQP